MSYFERDDMGKTLRVLVLFGGKASTDPMNELLVWLARPSVNVEARIVAADAPHTGGSVDERVDAAIAWADAAIAILTPDERSRYGAPNVMDEIGRWRGGKAKSALCIVRQDEVPPYANHEGLVDARFKLRINEAFDSLREFLLTQAPVRQVVAEASSEGQHIEPSALMQRPAPGQGAVPPRKRVVPWRLVMATLAAVGAVFVIALARNPAADVGTTTETSVNWTPVLVSSPLAADLSFVDEVRRGRVPQDDLMPPQDSKSLTEGRAEHGYQDSNGTLKGSSLRVFKSNRSSRYPRAVVVRDNVNAFAGIYVIRDRHPPDRRLSAVGHRVELPQFSESHSEYQLIAVVFALDEATDQQMAVDTFNLETLLELVWVE